MVNTASAENLHKLTTLQILIDSAKNKELNNFLSVKKIQKCMISGMPQSQITWLKDGQPLRTGSRVRLTNKDHVHITSVTKDDQGMFQCFVKNDVDMAQGVAEISLGEIAPILHYRFIEQTLQPGPGVSLKCTA